MRILDQRTYREQSEGFIMWRGSNAFRSQHVCVRMISGGLTKVSESVNDAESEWDEALEDISLSLSELV